jgi:hypothetical protein
LELEELCLDYLDLIVGVGLGLDPLEEKAYSKDENKASDKESIHKEAHHIDPFLYQFQWV